MSEEKPAFQQKINIKIVNLNTKTFPAKYQSKYS